MPRLVATPHLNFLLGTGIGLEARPDLKGISTDRVVFYDIRLV